MNAGRMTSSRNPAARLTLLLSAAVFAAGCGEAVVGDSELRNTAPTLGAFTDLTTDEDTLVTGSFTVADAEDLATLTFTVTSSDPAVVSSAGVVITGSGTDRTISILPEANASGLAVITVLVSDGEYSATGTFTITVLPINDPPVIAPIANESTTEELPVGPIRITVTDIDSPLGDLTLTAVSGDLGIVDAAGVMVAGSAGAFTVTLSPLPDAFGDLVITVTASDGAASSVASFTLTVTNVNDAPTITALTDLTTDEDTATAALPFTIADVDTPVGDLLVTVVSDNATLLPPASFMLGGSGASRTLTILPATQQNGSGTVTVTVSDGSLSGSTSFVLTVTAVDDAPEIMGVTNVTVMEDPAAVPTLAFTVVDVDTPAPTVTATSDNPALVPSGALTIVNGGGNAYTLSLPPLPNAFGMATIVITANDGVNAPVTSSFVFTVTPVNDAPVLTAVIPNRSTNEDTPLSFSYGISEIDDNLDTQVTYALELVSGSATLFPAANIVLGGAGVLRTVQLTPALNQNGVVRFRIVATDSGGSTPTVLTVSQEFDITVVAINDAPTIVPSAPVPNPLFAEERSFGAPPNIGPLTFTIADVETPLGSLTITAARANGTVIDTVTFVAQGGGVFELGASSLDFISGDETITITVTDNGAGGVTGNAQSTFAIPVSVVPVNDPPEFVSFSGSPTVAGTEDTASVVPFVVFDIDNAQPAAFPVSGGSAGFTLTATTPGILGSFSVAFIAAAGPNQGQWALTLNPAPNANGSTQITFVVRDPLGVSDPLSRDTVTFTYNVAATNDAPTIANVTNVTMAEDTVGNAVLSFNVSDIDDVPSTLVVTGSSSLPALVTNANLVPTCDALGACTLTITPQPNAFGVATITLTVADDGLPPGTASANFQLTVTNVPDAPVITAVADRTGASALTEDLASVVAVTVQDPDLCNAAGGVNGAESITLTASSSQTTLLPNANLVVAPTGGTCARTFNLTATSGLNQFSPPNATVTLTATSTDTLSGTDAFAVEINPVDDPPVISAIANQTISEDGMTTALAFTVTDVDTAITLADLQVLTSNGAVVPVSGITLASTGGSGNVTNWTVQVTPLPNTFTSGVPVTVTVRVLPGDANQTDETFTVTVNPVDDPPVITQIGTQPMDEDTTAMITLTVTDIDSPCSAITLSGTSSDTSVVANPGISDGTICPNHVLVIAPVADQFTSPPVGNTLDITVIANDGTSNSLPMTFALDVQNTDDSVVAANSAFATTWGVHLPAAVARTLTANDPDPVDTVAYRADSGTTTLGGFYQVFANGTFVYAPPTIYALGGPTGTADTFPFRAVTGGDTGADPCNAPTCDEATATVNLSGVQQLIIDDTVSYAACTDLPADEEGACGTDFRPFPTLGTDAVEADSVQWATLFTLRFGSGTYDTDANGLSLRAQQTVTGIPMPTSPVIRNATGRAVEIDAGAAGATLTAVDILAGGGEGVDARDDSVTLTNVDVTCTAAGAFHAVRLGGATSASTLTDVAIDRTNGGGVSAALFSSGGGITLGGTVTVDAAEASGVVLSATTVSSFSLASVIVDATALAVANRGIALDNVTGTVTVVSADITTRGGIGIRLNASTGLTLNAGGAGGSITTEGARALEVSGAVATLTLDDVTVTGSATGAINMTGAGGSNVAIGVLSATTTGGTAVSLNGPLTFGVSGATSTITATAGPAFVAANSALAVTLRTAASSGSATTGVSLTTTTGTFTVTGTGTTTDSGGVIASPGGVGVVLSSAAGVSLANLTVDADADTGMTITGASTVSLDNLEVTQTGTDETGITVIDLTGTLAIDGATISGTGLERGMFVSAATASPSATLTFNDLDIETEIMPMGAPIHQALVVSASGTESVDVVLTGASLITHGAPNSAALQVSATGASAVQVDTLGSTLSSTSRGLWALADGTSTTRVLVDTTAISAVRAAAFLDVLAPGAALSYDMSGGSLVIANGGPNRAAFDLLAEEGQADILLDAVTVTAQNATGILAVAAGDSDVRMSVVSSPVTLTSLTASFVGIEVATSTGSTATMSAALDGNTVTGGGADVGIRARALAAGSTTCVNAEDNASAGVTSSYTMGQTAGTFQFTGWNGAFTLLANLMVRGNTATGAAPVAVGTIAAGVCTAPTAVTPL